MSCPNVANPCCFHFFIIIIIIIFESCMPPQYLEHVYLLPQTRKTMKAQGVYCGKTDRTRRTEATKPPVKPAVACNLKSIGCNLP